MYIYMVHIYFKIRLSPVPDMRYFPLYLSMNYQFCCQIGPNLIHNPETKPIYPFPEFQNALSFLIWKWITVITEFLVEQGCVSSAPECGTSGWILRPLKPAARHGCSSLVSIHLALINLFFACKIILLFCAFIQACAYSFWTLTMGALRIQMSQTWLLVSPGERGSRDKEEVGDVVFWAAAGDSSFITQLLLPWEIRWNMGWKIL